MTTTPEAQPTFVFGPMVQWDTADMAEFQTPEWVEVEGRRFMWNPAQGAYDGLYIEPGLNDGTLTQDSYYEIED